MCKEEELLEQQPSEEAAQTMEEDREGEAEGTVKNEVFITHRTW